MFYYILRLKTESMDLKEYVTHGCSSASDTVSDYETTAYFDCNICLDVALDPVVTLCGHLYCWPCIYKWFHVQSASLASDEHPQCPVCKADVSHTTVVPLYSRGQTQAEAETRIGKSPYQSTPIPPRPAASSPRSSSMITTSSGQRLEYRNPYQNYNNSSDQHASYAESESSSTRYSHPVIWMLGEMVNGRMNGNSTNLFPYSSSSQIVQTSSLRARRHELQADKSLNRISVFLFFCFLLCLFLF